MELSELKMLSYNIPVILGGGINGIGLARSFGEKGIKTIILDTEKNFSFYSKYVNGIVCPAPNNEKTFIDFLKDFGTGFNKKPVIFVTNDHWMIPVSKNQKELNDFYLFSMSEWDVIQNCTDKSFMYKIAKENNIAIPKTIELRCISELNRIIDEINFPCILKPFITIDFAEKLGSGQRVFSIKDKSELLNLAKKIEAKGLRNREIIIQEFIPGGIETLYTITTYSNRNADIVCYSTGHKLRQRPPVAGTIISGKVIHKPELFEPTQKLIKALNFFGIANTEFKYDARDKTFKLMEINPRPGKWNYSVTASGINMPYILIKELNNEEVEAPLYSSKQLTWICFYEDFYNTVLGGFKKKGYPEFSLGFFKYLKTIKGKKVDAIFSLKDPLPALYYIFKH